MDKLKISKDFTIIDIHKLREYNYERRKSMTVDEIINDTKKGADEMQVRINAAKAKYLEK